MKISCKRVAESGQIPRLCKCHALLADALILLAVLLCDGDAVAGIYQCQCVLTQNNRIKSQEVKGVNEKDDDD